MRSIARDTNTSVGFKRGDGLCLEVIQNAEHLLLGATVLGELLAGFACGGREGQNREELRRFLDCRRVDIPPVGMETADAYALIYRTLRRQGRPIPTNDMWIAASCLELGAVLFSLDAHFDQVDGLRRIRCWAEAVP